MLRQEEVAPYLIERGLVDPRLVVRGDLAVVDATRRNSNFRVLSEGGPSYIVKQGIGPDRSAGVRNEACTYRLLHASASRITRYVPGIHLYSESDQVLIIELLRGARSLDRHMARTGRFSPALGMALGEALATLHKIPLTPPANGEPLEAPKATNAPWVLSVHRLYLELYHQVSNANLQLSGTIQRFPLYCGLLDALRGEWRHQSLVHYDVKLENLLVARPRAGHGRAGSELAMGKGRYSIAIVDWELAGTGDPSWDVGSVFGELLGFWLSSIPITGEQAPERFVELARFPLQRLHPAIRSFWESYERRAGLDPQTSTARLIRAVRYAGARLIQTAFEQSQALTHLTGNATYFLQFAFNILQQPLEAAIHLLGLSPRPEALRWKTE